MHSMKQFSLAGMFLLFGFSVLLVSLFSPNQELRFDGYTSSDRRTFDSLFVSEILPNHPAYAVLRLADWTHLQLTPNEEDRLTLYLQYAFDRLTSAEKLVGKNNDQLVVLTTIKGSLYLEKAAKIVEKPSYDTKRNIAANSVREYTRRVELLAEKISDAHKSDIEKILPHLHDLSKKISPDYRNNF